MHQRKHSLFTSILSSFLPRHGLLMLSHSSFQKRSKNILTGVIPSVSWWQWCLWVLVWSRSVINQTLLSSPWHIPSCLSRSNLIVQPSSHGYGCNLQQHGQGKLENCVTTHKPLSLYSWFFKNGENTPSIRYYQRSHHQIFKNICWISHSSWGQCYVWVFFFFFLSLFFSESRGGAERGRERFPSRLCTISADVRLELMNCEITNQAKIKSWTLNWLSYPGAPSSGIRRQVACGHFPRGPTGGGGDIQVNEQKECGGWDSTLTTEAVREGCLEVICAIFMNEFTGRSGGRKTCGKAQHGT